MKTLLPTLFVLVISFMLLACDQEEVNPVATSTDQHFFEATAVMVKTGGFPLGQAGPGMAIKMQMVGEGQSNSMTDITIETSHTEVFGEDLTSFDIENGKFLIRSVAGAQLYGSYKGFGTVQKDLVEIFETYQIEGGTGKFTNATGNLTVYRSQSVQYSKYIYIQRSRAITTNIYGTILLAKNPN